MIWDNIRHEKRIRSFVSGVEKAPTTGTRHLQCYFETESVTGHCIAEMQAWPCFDKRVTGGVAICGDIVRGSAEDQIKYCLKMRPQDLADGSGPNTEYVSWGPFDRNKRGNGGKQGRRTDWVTFRELAIANAPIVQFHTEIPHLSIIHRGKIDAIKNDYGVLPKRDFVTYPIIYYGKTRWGKSYSTEKLAAELAKRFNWRIYTKSDNEDWWPDYNGQEIVIIEEMDGSFFKWNALKRLFDRGEFTLRQKFNPAGTNLMARYIIMTTNDHPARWYPSQLWDEDNAFRARILEFSEIDEYAGLWNFSAPTVGADKKKVYSKPVRDMKLANPDVWTKEPDHGGQDPRGPINGAYSKSYVAASFKKIIDKDIIL